MKNLLKLFVTFLYIFVCSYSVAFAEQKVVVTEGKYVLSNLDSKQDAKALALIDAKRLALEQAGTYLESLPEAKNFRLNKDLVNSLAASIMSVDVLSEDWKVSGEILSVIIQIRATIETDGLQEKISRMQETDQVDSFKEMQKQLAVLQKELAELKAKQQKQDTPETNKLPSQEMKQKYETVIKNINALEYAGKGNIALTDQRWNDALYVLNKAIELNPELVDAYTDKAYALYNLKNTQEALTVINKALDISAQSARSLGIKALILKDQPGKTKLALATANSAIELVKTSPRLYRIRGEVYVKMGKTVLARKDFTTACEMGAKESCNRGKAIKAK
jgi:Flp pilus assembly protein TadD